LCPSAERFFPASAEEVSAARGFVRGEVSGWGLDPGDAALVVTELAANAVRHARSPFTVTVKRIDDAADAAVVEVTDTSPEMPALATPSPDATSGRGLLIVDLLARAWGTRPEPGGGKTVWAEFEARSRSLSG
jgi:signal transduction histidine kinase